MTEEEEDMFLVTFVMNMFDCLIRGSENSVASVSCVSI